VLRTACVRLGVSGGRVLVYVGPEHCAGRVGLREERIKSLLEQH
jgi:hypothetical protein